MSVTIKLYQKNIYIKKKKKIKNKNKVISVNVMSTFCIRKIYTHCPWLGFEPRTYNSITLYMFVIYPLYHIHTMHEFAFDKI